MKRVIGVVAALVFTFVLVNFVIQPQTARAAGQRPISEEWTYEVAPYVWFMSLNGTIGVAGQTVEIDASFSDLWEVTDLALAAAGTARKGRWGLYGNFLYAKLSDSQELPVPAVLDWEQKLTTFEFAAAYRPAFLGPVDLLVGGRYWGMSLDLNFKPGPSTDGDKDWIDPVIGFNLPYMLTDKWELDLGGSIGGFGVASDFSWELRGSIFYHFNHWLSAGLGYIHLETDYEDDGFVFDAALDGAAAAVKFSF